MSTKKTFSQNPLFSLDQYYELYKRLKVVQTLMRCLSRNSVHTSRSDQDSYVSKGGPLGGFGSCWQSDAFVEHRIWKRIRSMEYLGYGRGYLLVRGWRIGFPRLWPLYTCPDRIIKPERFWLKMLNSKVAEGCVVRRLYVNSGLQI